MELLILLSFVFIGILFAVVILLFKYGKFKKSTYQVASGNHFLQTIFDKGNYGEYLTYAYLEKLEGHHRLMTNLYIPKNDGTTTEIDLLMLRTPFKREREYRVVIDQYDLYTISDISLYD